MYDDYLPLTCMRRAATILSSRDKWRPADVPLQAVGVASLATLFIGLWEVPSDRQSLNVHPTTGNLTTFCLLNRIRRVQYIYCVGSIW